MCRVSPESDFNLIAILNAPQSPGGNPMSKLIAAVFIGLALAATAAIPAQAAENHIIQSIRW